MYHLSLDENRRVRWVLYWTERMTKKYGGTVYEKNGKRWDWGQALARECYGEDWMSVVPETPTWEDIARADRWEKGEIPEWAEM